MINKLRYQFLTLLDMVLIILSVYLSYLLRFDGDFSNVPQKFVTDFAHLLIISVVVKLICFLLFKLYNSLWKYAGIHELITIVAATATGNIALACGALIMQVNAPRSIYIIAFLLDSFFVGGTRFAYRAFRRTVKVRGLHKNHHKRVLIVGASETGAAIVRELLSHIELGSEPVAILDDDKYKHGKKIDGIPIVGTIADAKKVVQNKKIDEIIIDMASVSHKTVNSIYNSCVELNCKIKVMPSVFQLIDESVIMQKVRDVNIEDLLGRKPVNLDVDEVCNCIKGQTVLVTGGGGSIGSELCRQIASFSPKKLVILDNYENNAFEIQNELLQDYPNLSLEVIIANIRDGGRIEEIFAKYSPDVVFHAAAHKHVPLMELNPSEAVKNNVFGTLNVAESADKHKVKKFVLISTDKAVNPSNIMGATKRIAEMIVQAIDHHSDTEFVAVRFGNVLGSSGSVVPLFKKQIEKGGPVTVTHPEINRFFMTVTEAVELVLQAFAMAKGGEIFVLDMGEPVKIYELAKNLIRLSGFVPDEDIEIKFTGLRPGEKLYEEIMLKEEGLSKTKNDKIYIARPVFTDLAMLKRELNQLWQIVSRGLEEDNRQSFIEYMKLMVPNYAETNEGR